MLVAAFVGVAPAILTALTGSPEGTLFAPAWYVMLAAVVTLVALPFLRRHEVDQRLPSTCSSG